MATKLYNRISNHLKSDSKLTYETNTNASRIVSKFLEEYFGIDFAKGPETDDKIKDISTYLLRNDFEDIILFFWKCVGEVWMENLSAAGIDVDLDGDDIKNLSYWNGAKHHVERISDPILREEIITSVITQKLKDFFVYDSGGQNEISITEYNDFIAEISNDINVFKTVKFKYHRDLFIGNTSDAGDSSMVVNSGDSNHSAIEDQNTDETSRTVINTKALKTWGALEILAYIFNYGWFTESDSVFRPNLRHKILSIITAPVCPYCNRQYVTLFKEIKDPENGNDQNRATQTTADLDHFYIKSAYPFLALSVHNFVPSCQICNSRFKGTQDFHYSPHLYPYGGISGDEITFELKNPLLISDIKGWRDWDNEEDKDDSSTNNEIIRIIPAEGNVEAKNSIHTFRLEEVYQSHADYVHEIVWKAIKYNDIRLGELVDMFPGLFSSKDDAKEIVFGQYLDDTELYKRPLAKLTKDILHDLEITRDE